VSAMQDCPGNHRTLSPTRAPLPDQGRRRLLGALGLGGALAALGGGRRARAAEPATPPKRLLLVFSANGMVPERFWPGSAAPASAGTLDFLANGDLAALAPHKSDLLLLGGLMRPLHKLGGAHERAMGALWTGARLNQGSQFGGGGWPSGPSIDQILARRLPRATDFASLEVGVQPFGPGAKGGTMQHMCYAGSNQPVAAEASPARLFDRVFGADPNAGDGAYQRLRAERRSVLDLVQRDVAGLVRTVSTADRQKLESHFEGVRSIERRLESRPPEACIVPTPTGEIDIDANENFPALIDLQSDLLVSTFACDRTRVASLQWSRSFSMVRHTWLGNNEGHHTLSHDANQREILSAITRFYIDKLAQLIGKLAAVREGQGTLLDNTLVVYCNELHTGWDHKAGPSPTVLAGRLGGALQPGRYVDYGPRGVTHANLLVSICQAMGLPDVQRVGNLPGPEGPLPGLFV
jgi:hypothetical protein